MARASISEAAARQKSCYIFRLYLTQALGSVIFLLMASTTAHAYDPVTDCSSDLANAERRLADAEKLHDHWRQTWNQSYRNERSARDKWQSAECDLKANETTKNCSEIFREIESARSDHRSSKANFERVQKELNGIRRNLELINQRCSDPLPSPLTTDDEVEHGPEHRDEAARERIKKKLNELRNVIDKWTTKIDQCEAYANAAIDVSVSGGIANRLLPEHLKMSTVEASIAEAQRIASAGEKLKKLFDIGRQASNKVCARAQTSATVEKDSLERARLFSRGIYEGLKAQLVTAIAKLKEPLDRSGVEELFKSLNPKKEFCKKWPAVAKEAGKKIGVSSWGYAMGLIALQSELRSLERDISSTAKSQDIKRAGEFFVFKSQLTQLVKRKDSNIKRYQNCTSKLHLTDLGCKNLPEDVAGVDRLLSELSALDRRRQETLNKLTGVLNSLESDYAATKAAVTAGKDCIDRAEEQQAACDPNDSECKTTPETDRKTSDSESMPDSESASSESGHGPDDSESPAESESDASTTETDVVEVETDGDETLSESEPTKTEEEPEGIKSETAAAETETAEAARAEAEAAQAQAEAEQARAEAEQIARSSAQNGSGDRCAEGYGPSWKLHKRPDGSETCVPATPADADARCKDEKGSGYRAGKILSDGSLVCIPNKSSADAWCAKNNGDGYYAADISQSDGSFTCKPSKKVANNWCAENNALGWYATNANSEGGFDCYPGKSVRNASCQKKNGRGSRAGKPVRRGAHWYWDCSVGKPPRPGTRGPRANPEAGVIIKGVIDSIIRSQGGGRGVPPKSSQCHIGPDGRKHCGSN